MKKMLDDLTEIAQCWKLCRDNKEFKKEELDRIQCQFLDYLILKISFYNVLLNEGKHKQNI